MGILAELTGGRFRNGALARVLIMEFWMTGLAPTFVEFGRAWIAAKAEPRDLLSTEYAYLTDVQSETAGPGWKAKRREKAGRTRPCRARSHRGRVILIRASRSKEAS